MVRCRLGLHHSLTPRHRTHAEPMEDRGAPAAQQLGVEARPVAFVPMELIRRIQAMIKHHEAIAHDLRDDRGGGDCPAARIALHDGPTRKVRGWRNGAVDQDEIRNRGEIIERVPHGQECRAENVVPIDLLRADDADSHLRLFRDHAKGSLALKGC